ncbi:hypothetical protein ACFYU9_05100 [Streptomyces sp. NPDC004327]|uniref:hypothetical protein n=1 Tax=Streptomyces sp. NPDC004327 TaxID=3364699 RepID=UPI0036B5BA22
MTLDEGRRVRLASELELPLAGDVGGLSLRLAAGNEGTVERVTEHSREETPEAREYLRLASLLDAYGPQMPPASRKQLEEQIEALEPEWRAYDQRRTRVTVRVRLDNGFLLDDAEANLFAPLVP